MARKGENIFKRKDGRREGRYIKGHMDGKAVYGYVFGRSYFEVKEKKAAVLAAIVGKNKRETFSPVMGEIGILWLENMKYTCKKSTIAKYNNQLRKYIFPVFGSDRMDEITNKKLIQFSNGLLQGNLNSGKKLAPKSVSDLVSRMNSIRKFALLHGYEVGYLPDCVSIPQTFKAIRVLTFSEEQSLDSYLKKHPDLTALGIRIALFTGIRIGELCALTWSDISFSEQEIQICRTMQRLPNINKNEQAKTYIEVDKPKSRCSIRTIPIPANLIDDLKAAYVKDAYVLTGQSKRFMEPRTLENRLKAILRECGIAQANFHALRHTFATRCVEVGFDVKSLSECSCTVKKQKQKIRDRPPAPHYSEAKKPKTKRQALWKCA